VLNIKDIKSSIRNYENDEKVKVHIMHSDITGSNTSKIMNCLTEKGLYRLLYSSESELAKSFRNFVYELLHNLRLNKIKLIQNENIQLKQQLKSIEDNKIKGYVYKITNRITNEFYIGSTIQKSIYNRWNQHKKAKGFSKFARNIRKYGWINFTIEIHSEHMVINERELRYNIERNIRNDYKKNEETKRLLLNQRN